MSIRIRATLAVAFGVFFLLQAPVQAQSQGAVTGTEAWRDVQVQDIAARGTRRIVPRRYRTLALDRARLADVLSAAPHERNVRRVEDSPLTLALPQPDGGFAHFAVVESPVMEAELAAKFPQIRTWLGQGIDDPTATLRLDLTPHGFHAQAIGLEGTTYIDPFQSGDAEHYIAYSKREHVHGRRGVCLVEHPAEPLSSPAHRPQVASGATLRVYRLAMATTGEYAQFHGGSVIDGLSAIATTVNRVNGLYEREVAVRMVLVANNDQIVFTNPNTDPYANTSGDLNANQTTINSRIGVANYDIGHLVGTGGGGVAQLRSPCGTSKARGLTGSSAPIGDAFDVDYVAHEMGHQFGGNHTFNGSGGSCGGNRSASTAYEPGGGVTIQGYAGICGGDDLQPNSEDYFHRVSLDEILAFVGSPSGACGVPSASGNTPPTVDAPAGFTIPGRTPFTLAASGGDANGDALTYVWEQFDLGDANVEGRLDDDATDGPMFRSFVPLASPERTFPDWRWILQTGNVPPQAEPLPGTDAPDFFTGEVLPNVSRTLTFQVTVRDNRAGGGGTNEAQTAIVVDNSAGPFRISAPDGGETLAAGSDTQVTWDVAGTEQPAFTTTGVRITLSLDGGMTFPIVLQNDTPNDGAEDVTLPAGLASSQARVRVQANGNVFFDVSDDDFTVTTAGNTPPTINVVSRVETRQGAPTANVVVAQVGDAEQAAGSLTVSVSGAPTELQASVQNVDGAVTLSVTAGCSLVAPTFGSRAYPLLVSVTDGAGAVRSAEVFVDVGANRTPTLGAYPFVSMTRDTQRVVVPQAPAGDADGNLVDLSITPTVLPGGGTLALAPDGTLTATTTPGTTDGATQVGIRATDACGAVEERRFAVAVGDPFVTLVVERIEVVSGNALVEPNECNQFNLILRNDGNTPATDVSANLTTAASNVLLTQPAAGFADIPPAQSRTSSTPFEISTAAGATCFSNVALNAAVSYGGLAGSSLVNLGSSLPIGRPIATNYSFQASSGATLPAGGTLVPGSESDDAVVALTVPAGFSFRLYGNTYAGGTALRASINGNLQVRSSGGATDAANLDLPAIGAGASAATRFPASAPTLFLQWDDWRTDAAAGGAGPGAGIYTQLVGSAPNRQWIIEWRGRIRGDGAPESNNNRAAVVLYENSSRFDYVYLDTGVGPSSNGAGSTIGVQGANSGSVFTRFAHNDANLAPGTRLTATLTPAECNAGGGGCPLGAPAVTVTQSGGSTDVGEDGSNDSYTVVLDAVPASSVTIALAPGSQLETSPVSLQFTTSNWNFAQTVAVAAVDDAVVEGAHGGTIVHSASGGGYDGVPIANVVANVADDDAVGVTLVQSDGNTAVGESGAGDSYTLVLNSQPTADVTIALAAGNQVQVPASVVFTPGNWDDAQSVSVDAVDDVLFEGPHGDTITHTVSGGDYAGVAVPNVAVTVADDDPIPVDLSVTNAQRGTPVAGQRLHWDVEVSNVGAVGVATADFAFTLPATLTGVSWTCVAEAGGNCPAGGNGAPAHAIVLASGSVVRYTIGADVPDAMAVGTPIPTNASVAVTLPYADAVPADNSDGTADVVRAMDVFYSGFE